ncbi:MAG: DUF2933 domain-containing protein [Candidatus Magasanikbacteria bacterium]|nr:DUF2933 domain-containing protein [Candidatus Magasanikbacteria bacterium]
MNVSLRKIIIICAAVLAAIILLPKFFPSLSGNNFIWLIFLLCPLMHIFMMKGGHGEGHNHGGDENGHGAHSCCGGHKNEQPADEKVDKK